MSIRPKFHSLLSATLLTLYLVLATLPTVNAQRAKTKATAPQKAEEDAKRNAWWWPA
ncbi:MAG: hypothetical protein OSB47_03405 [Pirellulaceae bacterium]|nr:hypothetical protein [Pirellulaceae bacterium]